MLSSTCISFADSSKAVQILLIIFFIFHVFMLSSPGDIYVKNLTLYCGGVCGGGGAINALLV